MVSLSVVVVIGRRGRISIEVVGRLGGGGLTRTAKNVSLWFMDERGGEEMRMVEM